MTEILLEPKECALWVADPLLRGTGYLPGRAKTEKKTDSQIQRTD